MRGEKAVKDERGKVTKRRRELRPTEKMKSGQRRMKSKRTMKNVKKRGEAGGGGARKNSDNRQKETEEKE